MTSPTSTQPLARCASGLIDDMNIRRFFRKTQRNDLRDIGRLATFFGR